jgi:hypothetical protein
MGHVRYPESQAGADAATQVTCAPREQGTREPTVGGADKVLELTASNGAKILVFRPVVSGGAKRDLALGARPRTGS